MNTTIERLRPFGRDRARRIIRALLAQFSPLEKIALGLRWGLYTRSEITEIERLFGQSMPWAVPAPKKHAARAKRTSKPRARRPNGRTSS